MLKSTVHTAQRHSGGTTVLRGVMPCILINLGNIFNILLDSLNANNNFRRNQREDEKFVGYSPT